MGLLNENWEVAMMDGGGSFAGGPDRRTPYQKRLDAEETLGLVLETVEKRLEMPGSVPPAQSHVSAPKNDSGPV